MKKLIALALLLTPILCLGIGVTPQAPANTLQGCGSAPCAPGPLTTVPSGVLLTSLSLGQSNTLTNPNIWLGQLEEISQGTVASPVSTTGPTIKISRTQNYTTVPCTNAVDNECDAGLSVIINSGPTDVMQPAAIVAEAESDETGVPTNAVIGLLAKGRVYGSGVATGQGAYIEGRRDTATGNVQTAEMRSFNNTASNCSVSYTGIGSCDSSWVTAQGNGTNTTNNSSAYHIGVIPGSDSNGWAEGVTINNNAVVNFGFNDQSSSTTSINVGSGHTNTMLSPGYALDGSGNNTSLSFNATSTANPYKLNGVIIGWYPVDPGTGYSVFLGQGAGGTTTAANLAAMTKGFFTCVGSNTCGGAGTGMVNAGANVENSAFGWDAGSLWTTAVYSTALGVGTMRNDPTSANCIAVGVDSMGQEGITTGCSQSIGIGVGSLKWGNTGPVTSVAIGGDGVLGGSTAGTSVFTSMVAIGDASFSSASAGTLGFDTAIGAQAGKNQISGNYSFYGGYDAGGAETTGAHNVIIAPTNLTPVCQSGNGVIIIGYEQDCLTASSSNEINIGGIIFANNASTAAPSVSSCGTSPTIDSRANNRSGTVTVGTGTIASCTITFASAYATWDHCRVTSQTSETTFAYSYTTAAITATAVSLTSDKIDYDCDGY